MKNYADVVLQEGNGGVLQPAAGATVTVINAVSLANAQLYSDDGVTPISNPVACDTNGRFNFFVANGRYNLLVAGANVATYEISNVDIHDETDVTTAGSTPLPGNLTFSGRNAFTGTTFASSLNGVVAVDGVKYATAAAALADPACATGCTIDMRGNNSVSALALGTFDPGVAAGPVTLLLGPYTYNASQVVLRSYFHLAGAARGATKIQSTSTSTPVFVLGGTTATYSVRISDLVVFCGAGNTNQIGFNITAPISGGGLNYSEFDDVTVGGDGLHECGGGGILLDGSNGGSPPAINQFLNFNNVQTFRAPAGGPALHIRGVNGQMVFTNCQFDGSPTASRDTLPNVVIEDSAFAGFTAAYSIVFNEVTTQRGGIGIQLRGVTNFVCDTCHFENVSGMVNAAIGQNYGNQGVVIRNSYCAVNCAVNSGAGYLVTMDGFSQIAFDNNSTFSSPDNFFLGTLTHLEHHGLRNFFGGLDYTAPNSSWRIPVGIDGDSPGIKFAATAFTGVTAGAYAEVDVNWTTAFADGSYVPVCSVYDFVTGTTSAGLRFERLSGSSSLSPSGIKAVVFNASGGTLNGTLFCIAIHI